MVAYKNKLLDRYEMIRTDWEFIENGYLFRWKALYCQKIEMNYELLFPIGYREDFRELMEYIDSQFALIENENSQTFISYLDE